MLEILLGNALVAAGLALVVLLVGRFFKPSPAARHALWLVVMVKLLSPVGFVISLPLPFEQPEFLAVDRSPAATLSKEKAETLAAFLKANVKAPVLELQVLNEGLVVTTTPEVQSAIGNLVNLMKSP